MKDLYTENYKTLLCTDLHSEENHYPNEKAIYWMEKIFANHISNKRLISKIYKKLIQLNNSKNTQTTRLKNEQKAWTHIFPKRTHRCQKAHEKMCLNIKWCLLVMFSLIINEIQIKTMWDIISHLLEWISSKRQEITSVGEDVEKRELLYTVGKSVNWYSHAWKTARQLLKKIKNRTTILPSYFSSGYLSKECSLQHYLK